MNCDPSRQQNVYTCQGHLTNAATCPGASVSALVSQRSLSTLQPQELPHSEFTPWLHCPVPLWLLSFLRVRFDSYSSTNPYMSLRLLRFRPMASLPHPLPLQSPQLPRSSHPAPVCCSNTIGEILAGSAQHLIITEGLPDPGQSLLSPLLSFFTTLITTWHRIFLFILCLSPIRVLFYYILSTAVYQLQEPCLFSEPKG